VGLYYSEQIRTFVSSGPAAHVLQLCWLSPHSFRLSKSVAAEKWEKVIGSNKKLSNTNWKYLIEQLGFLKTFEIVEIVYCCSLRVVDIIV
jgi:hypothetical protein